MRKLTNGVNKQQNFFFKLASRKSCSHWHKYDILMNKVINDLAFLFFEEIQLRPALQIFLNVHFCFKI